MTTFLKVAKLACNEECILYASVAAMKNVVRSIYSSGKQPM